MSLPTSPNPSKEILLDGFMLPSKYILGSVTKIFLLFTFACFSAFKMVYYSICDLPLCNYTTKISVFKCLHVTLAIIISSLKVLMILFGFDLNYFKRFISTMELLSIAPERSALRTIKRNRQLNLIILSMTFIGYSTLRIRYRLASIQNLFEATLLILCDIFIEFGLAFLLNMICNICICLKAAFKEINSKIADLNETPKQVFNSFDEIRNLRKRYSYAVRATKHADKLFRYFIAIFYIEYFAYNNLNIVRSFGLKTQIDSLWLFVMLSLTIHLLILTYNLVSVNNLSRQGLEDLYELSFKLNSLHLYHENEIFMARMALSDVGFTFANLFTINNSFITSMFSLSLTIIIALTSLIYR
uniref:Gustatory receptor n=1 Tax=Tetranychus urticae TaxID=32264 RepID=T1KPB2_TETUR